jgi:hypothetical protein
MTCNRGESIDDRPLVGMRTADHHPPRREEVASRGRHPEQIEVVGARERRELTERPICMLPCVGADPDERVLELVELVEGNW